MGSPGGILTANVEINDISGVDIKIGLRRLDNRAVVNCSPSAALPQRT